MTEPTDPEDFHVLVIGKDADEREQITRPLENEFRFTVQSSSEPIAPPEHTIAVIIDGAILHSAPQQLHEQYQDMPIVLFNGDDVPESERVDLDEMHEQFYSVYGPPKKNRRRLKRILKKHSRSAGFLLTRGKIGERLVQRSLSVTISVDGDEAEGATTGVNFGGLGARVTGAGGFTPSVREEGVACHVGFNDEDVPDVEATGTILQVRPSFDSDYDAFMTVEFDEDCPFLNDDEARAVLKGLIRQQHDQSALQSGRSFRESGEED